MTKETTTERFQRLHELRNEDSATLWKALDLQTNQFAVLKCPYPPTDAQSRDRIEQEAHAYEYLKSKGPIPGLVSFLSYETNEEGPVLALEFLPGKTLCNYLINQSTLPEKKIISIGRALCQVVGQLHERGVIHRDLSLNNVLLLEGSEEVRLIDLGLALVPTPDGKNYEPHELGQVGTLAIMAPELSTSFSGDRRSDIYSLGRLLYQITVGLDTKTKEMETSFGVTRSVSDEFKQVIFRCTNKNPQDRYQTVGELSSALAALSTVSTKKVSPKPVPTKNKRPSGIGLLILGIGLSLGGAAIMNTLLRTSESQPPPSPTVILVERLPQLPPTEVLIPSQQMKNTSPPEGLELISPKETMPQQSAANKDSGKGIKGQATADEEAEERARRADRVKAMMQPLPTPGPVRIEITSDVK